VPKVQSQAGVSLADVYDVEGSVAGVEEILSKDVNLFHEMGGEIMSERMHQTVLIATSGNVAQSSNFSRQILNFIDVPTRVLGVAAIGDVAGRMNNVAISIRTTEGSEFPLLVWDDAQDQERIIRYDLDGVGVADMIAYIPDHPILTPTLLSRDGELTPTMLTFIMNATTSAFGAGNLVASMIVHVMRPSRDTPAAGDARSYGLPLPGW